MKTIQELVRQKESEFSSGSPTTISKYVSFDLNENNNRIDAYINSRHITGDKDSKGRDKPFEDITTIGRNIWFWATDIDRKNCRIKGGKRKQFVQTFLANVLLQNWMRKSNFGTFLNEWGLSLATYGSSIVKFVKKDGDLIASVVPWNRLIVDNVDVDNDIKIEKLFFTPAQLRQNKTYDQKFVKQLLDAVEARTMIGSQKKDNKSEYIPVYEVHGNMEVAYITDDWENHGDDFTQQMHVVSFVESKNSGEYDDFTLYRGREEKDPLMITHLIKEDGRATGIGAVEHLFESQWMVNHTAKAIKDKLDIVSKELQQTADGAFMGRNTTTDMDHGDVLLHAPNSPLSPVQWNISDIPSLFNQKNEWKATGRQANGVSEAMAGDNPPSGQAWRTVQALLQESHSLFELMTENKGLEIEKMFRTYVIPFLKEKLDTADEIAEVLDAQMIKQLDMMYTPNEAARRYNEKAVNDLLSGEIPSPYQKDIAEQQVREEWAAMGSERFFKPSEISDKTWKDVLKDLEWDVEVEVTSEAKDKQSLLTSLDTLLKTLIALNGRPMSNEEKMVFNKILEETGAISPLELSQLNSQSPQPMMPQGGIEGLAGGSGGQVLPTNLQPA